MAEHNDLGKEGEQKAREYLQAKGYYIRHTNWFSEKNELDIVAEKDGMLVVVEVKSRSSEYFEHPKDAITDAKIRRIVQATHDYIMQFDIQMETRFDVVAALTTKSGGYKIEHIEDAFMAPIN
jgi:putative endonuclease